MALIAAAGVFRLIHLGGPMRTDEATTFLFLQNRNLWEILSVYSPNNHLIHSLLVKLSTSVFGTAEWAVRLPAFLAGWALVPSLGYTAGRVFGPVEGFMAASLATCTGWLIAYSVDARGYSLAVFCLIWAFYHIWQGTDSKSKPNFFWAGVLAGLAVATVLSQLWALAGLGAISILASGTIKDRAQRALLISVGALIGGGIWYFPAILNSGLGSIISNAHTTGVGYAAAARSLVFQIPELFGNAWPTYGNGLVMVALSLAAGIIVLRDGLTRPLLFIAFMGLWSFAMEFLQGVRAPVRTFMYLVPLIQLIWIKAAISFWKNPSLRPGPAWVILLVVILMGGFVNLQGPSDSPGQGGLVTAREAALVLVEEHGLGRTDRILADVPDEAPLSYYLVRQGLPQGLILRRGELAGERIFIVESDRNPLSRLTEKWPDITGLMPNLIKELDAARIWSLDPPGKSG